MEVELKVALYKKLLNNKRRYGLNDEDKSLYEHLLHSREVEDYLATKVLGEEPECKTINIINSCEGKK